VAIDAARFPHARREVVSRAARRAVPRQHARAGAVLSGLEQVEPTETELRDAVRQVLRQHRARW